MIIILPTAIILLSILIADLAMRKVYLFQLILLAVLSIIFGLHHEYPLKVYAMNLLWVTLQLLLLSIYAQYIKRQRLFEIFGLGDVLFLFAIVPLLPTDAFIFYYITSLIFCLLTVVFFNRAEGSFNRKIPLAGLMAFWMLPFLFGNFQRSLMSMLK